MNIRSFLGLTLALTLAACSDSTAPKDSPILDEKSVALATATATDSVWNHGSNLFGLATFDSTGFKQVRNFGYDIKFMTASVLLEGSTKAALFTSQVGAGFYVSETQGATVRVLSDWHPVNAEQHRGFVGTNTTDFIFIIEKYKFDPQTKSYTSVSRTITTMTKKAGNTTARLDLPAEKDMYYSVNVMQRQSFACAGDDAIDYESTNGLVLSRDDIFLKGNLVTQGIRSTHVTCGIYSGASANALRARMLETHLK
ncbi:hypothetical protein KW800_01575 [Candidatus Parcubacteria bacterium]|nr:hypothetical protein [Candidatus Parcubacteria bacterium]